MQLRDRGFDFIERAVWRVLRLLASIADEFALVVRRDFAVAAKRSRWAFVTWILRPGLHCRPCLAAILAQRDHRVPKAVRIAIRYANLFERSLQNPPG